MRRTFIRDAYRDAYRGAVILSALFLLSSELAYSAKPCVRHLTKKTVSKESLAEKSGLHYATSDDLASDGITRVIKGKSVTYFDAKGRRITDPQTIERIRSLNIPYVYKEVWISPDPLSHIQATARDIKGRAQYRYHPQWIEIMSEYKFERMIEFGTSLVKVRAVVADDIIKKGMPKEKTQATVVRLLEVANIRIGNKKYADDNASYGLTTMLKTHVAKLNSKSVTFDFKGKSSVAHIIEVEDAEVASVIKELMKKPGKKLFQYEDDTGILKELTSVDVNLYLKENAGPNFSVKDYRTWWGTVTAADAFYRIGPPQNEKEAKAAIKAVMEEVADKLHNTPSVAKSNYVAPVIIESYLDGSLFKTFSRAEKNKTKGLSLSENAVLLLLK